MRTAVISATLFLLLAACGGGDDQGVGGLSADEAAQLDNAAEMLDASPDSMVAPEDMPLGIDDNEAAPAEASGNAADENGAEGSDETAP